MVRATRWEDFRGEISSLIVDGERRARLGERTRAMIVEKHVAENWASFLEDAYRAAAAVAPVAPLQVRPDEIQINAIDIRLATIHKVAREFPAVDEIIFFELGLLPLRERMKLWKSRFHARPELLPHCLLPEWARSRLRRWISRRPRPEKTLGRDAKIRALPGKPICQPTQN
jgi:hypothetical protein